MEKVSEQTVVMAYFLSPTGEYCVTEFLFKYNFYS